MIAVVQVAEVTMIIIENLRRRPIPLTMTDGEADEIMVETVAETPSHMRVEVLTATMTTVTSSNTITADLQGIIVATAVSPTTTSPQILPRRKATIKSQSATTANTIGTTEIVVASVERQMRSCHHLIIFNQVLRPQWALIATA